MKAAVIGIGSNSVRMLVVETDEAGFRRLRRDREGTRLFAGLDAKGRLSGDSMLHTARAVARMAESAREEGAERVDIFATSASRDAANGADFARLIRELAGAEPVIVSGEEEAALSFWGASAVIPGEGRRGVIDIGGGSTEIVTGGAEGIETAFSCQMGAVRLYNQFELNSREDMALVERAASSVLEERMAQLSDWRNPECWVGTGGTFTTLAAMVKKVPWTERTMMHGTEVTLEEVRSIGGRLADMTLAERKALPGLQPGRADIVVHGICILLAVMDSLKIDRLTVSEWGNLDGYVRRKLMRV